MHEVRKKWYEQCAGRTECSAEESLTVASLECEQ